MISDSIASVNACHPLTPESEPAWPFSILVYNCRCMSTERREPVRMVRLLRHPSETTVRWTWHSGRAWALRPIAAAREMTAEVDAIRGEHGDQPRLDKSVVRLI